MTNGMLLDPSSKGNPFEERTKSGLIVPKGTIKLKRRVITNQEWKLWRRAYKSAHALGVDTYWICRECKNPMLPRAEEKVLVCKCTSWELPGFEKLVIVKGTEDGSKNIPTS